MSFRPCIIVPVYNHGRGAVSLSKSLSRYDLPVIMVNDGSDPENTKILHDLAGEYDWIDVVDHPENQGKGGAVMTALKEAFARGYSHALQIDADGQHNVDDISKFLAVSRETPDAVVMGHPVYDDSVPIGRLVARYLTHVWVWIETLSFTIRDSMCGFRVYPLAATNQILTTARLGRRMDFDPEILVRLFWAGGPLISLETRVTYPPDGQSHFRLWEDNWLISCMHTRLFFGMLLRFPVLIWRKLR